jgi:hypothetical protein
MANDTQYGDSAPSSKPKPQTWQAIGQIAARLVEACK